MNIADMHVWFRQYAQQMGMQNVRAILPEQIDLMINTSISDIINQLIKENIGITNDRVVTDNSKIGQINAFATLYKVKEIPTLYNAIFKGNSHLNQNISEDNIVKGSFLLDKSDVKLGKIYYNNNSNKGEDVIDNTNHLISYSIPDALFFVDFSLNYKVVRHGISATKLPSPINNDDTDFRHFTDNNVVYYNDDSEITNYFPVRLIDDAYLADTLNDFVLKPRLRSPIMVMYNHDIALGNWNIELYIDKFIKDNADRYTLLNRLMPYNLRISYIAKPAQVRYSEDVNGINIDCDLPESMHVDILKHAVDLYRIAITGSLQAAQQQAQQQQQENTRNQYRGNGQ